MVGTHEVATSAAPAGSRTELHAPVERLHHLLLSLFASGEEFRRWVTLGLHGQDLVAAFPENSVSTAAALFGGIDVLRRHGHLNDEFFARLFVDFPLRNEDIRSVAAVWITQARPAIPQRNGRTRSSAVRGLHLTILIAIFSLGIFHILEWNAHRPSPDLTPRVETAVASTQADVRKDVVDARPPDRRRVSVRGKPAPHAPDPPQSPALAAAADEAEPIPRARPACELSPALIAELKTLASTSISSPAVTERFTVILRLHAPTAEVSPRPTPGQTGRKLLFERLMKLGPEALDRCRDVPIDVTFSKNRTMMTPRVL